MTDRTGKSDNGMVDAMITGISIEFLYHSDARGVREKVVGPEATVQFDGSKEVTVPIQVAERLRVGRIISVPRKPVPDYETWALNVVGNPDV